VVPGASAAVAIAAWSGRALNFWREETCGRARCLTLRYEQALVCLSNKKKSTRADVDHLIAKWRVTVVFSNCFRLIYSAI